jgi:hypothetical protein
MRRSRIAPSIAGVVVILASMWLRHQAGETRPAPALPASEPQSATAPVVPPREAPSSGNALVAQLFATHRSNVEVEIEGMVVKTLAEDRQGSPHQRFLVRVTGGPTVLVAHNIDIASRVPVKLDGAIRMRGEYVWNAKGGIVHWTHHDPAGRHANGWIEIDGHRYE